MRERSKAVNTVSSTDARIIHATEWQVGMQEMHNGQINPHRSGAGASNDLVNEGFAFVENIKRQRLGIRVDLLDHLVDVFIFDDWQDRPKQFFPADLHVGAT